MAKKGNIVKRTKSNVNLLLIVLVAVGWLCAVSSLLNDEDLEAQNALVQTADELVADKLYTRAVNNYKEALNNYTTKNNQEIEDKLLAAYLEAEMMVSYYDLIEDRISIGTAQEAEYLEYAKEYIRSESYSRAIDALKTGIERFQNEEMIQLKEEIIYQSRKRTALVADVKQKSSVEMIPVFDGTHWGYVNLNGDAASEFIYEEALPFAGSYAVVKQDGGYKLIDASGYWNAVDKVGLDKVTDLSTSAMVGVKDGKYQIYSRTFQPLSQETYDCVYMNDNGLYVVQKDGKWAILSAELEPVTDYVFDDVAVNSQGRVFYKSYAVVKDANGYYMVNAKGEELFTQRFANAKGMEGGLCAVADASGKWGFINERGEIVVDYQYTDAYGFSNNLAAVQYAGKWGYINRYNTMVFEAEYEHAYPFVEGSAVAKTTLGAYEIINLKYFDQF